MNRDNADVIHQMSLEIAIEADVVVDDRGHTQTVMVLANHGICGDVPTMMFVTVIGVTIHLLTCLCCERSGTRSIPYTIPPACPVTGCGHSIIV